jgi:4,5-dihydroxyphthalate decarboxylase
MFPWFSRLVEEDLQIFPEDWWPYGVKANRNVVDTLLRYHYEQGLSKRRLTCEEVFVPELLGT